MSLQLRFLQVSKDITHLMHRVGRPDYRDLPTPFRMAGESKLQDLTHKQFDDPFISIVTSVVVVDLRAGDWASSVTGEVLRPHIRTAIEAACDDPVVRNVWA